MKFGGKRGKMNETEFITRTSENIWTGGINRKGVKIRRVVGVMINPPFLLNRRKERNALSG